MNFALGIDFRVCPYGAPELSPGLVHRSRFGGGEPTLGYVDIDFDLPGTGYGRLSPTHIVRPIRCRACGATREILPGTFASDDALPGWRYTLPRALNWNG